MVLRTGSWASCSSRSLNSLGFTRGEAETYVPVGFGITGLIVTFFTNHKYGIVRKIPMIWHLWEDGFAGILLAISYCIYGFADVV